MGKNPSGKQVFLRNEYFKKKRVQQIEPMWFLKLDRNQCRKKIQQVLTKQKL